MVFEREILNCFRFHRIKLEIGLVMIDGIF